MSTALTLYGTNVPASVVSTAGKLATALGGTQSNTSTQLGTGTGWGEITALGTTAAWAGLGSIGTPTDLGWVLDATTLEGQQILAGTWTPTLQLSKTLTGNVTADIVVRAWVRHSNGTKTAIGSWTVTGQTIQGNTTWATFSPAPSSASVTNFQVGDKLYVDAWANVTTNGLGQATAVLRVRISSTTLGLANNIQVATPGYQPTPPTLATSPSSLTFTATTGGANPASQNSTLSETGGGTGTGWTYGVTYGSGSGWLSINPTSGTLAAGGSQVVAFSVVTSGLTAGTYTATITYTANTGGATATVSVTFTVSAPTTPVLGVSPTSLSFSTTFGGVSPATQNDTLSETAGLATAWTSSITYTSGSGWLGISPTSGNLAAMGTQTIVVTATLGALAVGTYSATIKFTATTGGSTASISVSFTVNAPTPLSASPATFSFMGTTGGANPPSQNDTLSETAGTGTNWTSSINYGSGGSGWLALSPSSGTLGILASQQISLTCTTGTLSAGTYSATITYTAVTGGATTHVSVFFILKQAPPKPNSINLAGQDITLYVAQETVEIDDTLGQGGGAGSSGSTQGRAATIKFNTTLGPMSSALGAGQTIHPINGRPALVRQGEIIVLDASGSIIFGGFATKYTDTTTSVLGQTKQNFTTVEGIDYSTSLQRTLVNEVFSAQTDIQIIRFIMQKYAGWVNLQYLPNNPAYTFPIKNFRNVTVEQVLQTIAGVTGYMVFVDYQKNLHYIPPTVASSAPFNLSSSPDFVTTQPHSVVEFLVDDNSAINRVKFYGGTKLSNDFTQDVSPLANGNNKVFLMAYYASPTSDGKYHVLLNGVEQVVGTASSTGAANTFISAGGLAQVLIDPGSRTATFDNAPASGATVLLRYRYNFPMSIQLTDEKSHAFFGDPYLDGSIDDNTVFDVTTAIQRCKVLLAQQSFGLVSLKVDMYKAGVQAGMLIQVTNPLRGINGSYLVQQVQISPLGGGNFIYHLSLGAWNWNLIDWLLKVPTLATFQDDQQTVTETVVIQTVLTNVKVNDAWATKTSQQGVYYARSAPVGDGHDAYPGLSTITS